MAIKTVAVFDDEIDIRELLKYNLSKEGFQVVAFPSPALGLDFILHNKPDIILSDWLMPDMNGLEFCKHIKNDDALSKIPVIMISCKGDDNDIQIAMNNGADDYLVKPFRIKELVSRINHIIETAQN